MEIKIIYVNTRDRWENVYPFQRAHVAFMLEKHYSVKSPINHKKNKTDSFVNTKVSFKKE